MKLMSKLVETNETQTNILSELIKSNKKEPKEEEKKFYEKAFEAINKTLSLIKEIKNDNQEDDKNNKKDDKNNKKGDQNNNNQLNKND